MKLYKLYNLKLKIKMDLKIQNLKIKNNKMFFYLNYKIRLFNKYINKYIY